MKKILFFLVLFNLVIMFGCVKIKRTFDYEQMVQKVKDIHIVKVENVYKDNEDSVFEFIILQSVKEEDLQNYLSDFCKLKYGMIIGTPIFPQKDDICIMLDYNNDTFEIFNKFYTRLLDLSFKVIEWHHFGCSDKKFEELLNYTI